MPWDGQPLQSTAAMTLGATNVFDPVAPVAATGDPGLQIPNTQLHGDLSFRVPSGAILGVIYEHGFAQGAHAVTSTQPPVDNGPTGGGGISLAYSFGHGPLRVGVATELLDWQVPWVQYSTCLDYCGPVGYTVDSRGTDNVWTYALQVTPSYRDGPVTWFGGLTLLNHPNLDEKTIDNGQPPDVSEGPLNVIGAVGASIELSAGVRATVIVHQDFTANPVRYGPSFAALFTIPIGRDDKPFVSPYDRQAAARSGGAP